MYCGASAPAWVCYFRKKPCDLVVLTLVALDRAIKLEFEDGGESCVDGLAHQWLVFQCHANCIEWLFGPTVWWEFWTRGSEIHLEWSTCCSCRRPLQEERGTGLWESMPQLLANACGECRRQYSRQCESQDRDWDQERLGQAVSECRRVLSLDTFATFFTPSASSVTVFTRSSLAHKSSVAWSTWSFSVDEQKARDTVVFQDSLNNSYNKWF